jgi:hypothetical protein
MRHKHFHMTVDAGDYTSIRWEQVICLLRHILLVHKKEEVLSLNL